MSERRKYDAEFREGAVTIVRETGKPIVEVARDLGIGAGTLGNWVKKDRLARGDESVRGSILVMCVASNARSPSCGWSVMSSSYPWSCGSRRRRDDRGVVRRRPEDRAWCSPCDLLSSPRAQRVVVLQVAHPASNPASTTAGRPRRGGQAIVRRLGGRYGSPWVLADLVADGWRVSKKSVAASMARQGLVARPTTTRRLVDTSLQGRTASA